MELEENTKDLMNKISLAISNNIPFNNKVTIPAFQALTEKKEASINI